MRYTSLVDASAVQAGVRCHPDVLPALVAGKSAVADFMGNYKINSLFRSCAEQQPLADKYAAWLKAGKPDPAVPAACTPGRSNHQGGRATDLNTIGVFPKAPADKQVDLLWQALQPHGWRPIIDQPDENRSERWHFDYAPTSGPGAWWLRVHDRYGYDAACVCSALDVGEAGRWQSDTALVQSLLLRAGYAIGGPDGIIGPHTAQALQASGTLAVVPPNPDASFPWLGVIERLRALPEASGWR